MVNVIVAPDRRNGTSTYFHDSHANKMDAKNIIAP
jgi:hypothetical protein